MCAVDKKSLLDLTNAYLAIEGLLQSRLLSEETRQSLAEILEQLNRESEKLLSEHAAELEAEHLDAIDRAA